MTRGEGSEAPGDVPASGRVCAQMEFAVMGPPYNRPHPSQEAESHRVAAPETSLSAARAVCGLLAKPGSALGATGIPRARDGGEGSGEASGARLWRPPGPC